jgi:phosphosulfolactate synthase
VAVKFEAEFHHIRRMKNMKATHSGAWHPLLSDPIGQRDRKRPGFTPAFEKSGMRNGGRTMVLDKGLGWHAFSDLIETAWPYIDFIKLGFGTAPLYPTDLLLRKILLAKRYGVVIMPGGTMLETAVHQDEVPSFFETVCGLGFDGIEVSDGTIELSRPMRTELIREGVRRGLNVCTEYGKKAPGSCIDPEGLERTAELDWQAGADLVTIEARESGTDVGMFDKQGSCREDTFEEIILRLPDVDRIMWEAPLKSQQVFLINAIGADVHLGNIPPADVVSLEAMRRGLRSDTFPVRGNVPLNEPVQYMI